MRPSAARVAVAAVASFVALAACSSSSKSSTTTSTRAPDTTGSTTSPTSASGSSASPSWATYHGDAARTGRATSGPGPAVRRVWSSPTLDGGVYAEPLVAGGMVIAATERDSVYALAADTGAVRWRAQLGRPVSGSSLPCGNIDPSGITSTPVIDTARGIVFVVAFLQPAHHELVALDLATGAVRFRTPIDPSGADPKVEQQRAALALDGDQVLVPFGGLFGDCGSYHGYLVSAGADGSGVHASYQVPAPQAAAIWAPPGPVLASNGDIFVSTGNATGQPGSPDLSDSVLRLSPQLQLVGSFTPSNRLALSRADLDLGSLAPALLDGNRIFQAGKEGVGYLLDGDHLSGSAALHQEKICGGGGAYGGTAYAPPLLFVPCRSGLVALTTTPTGFSVAWRSPGFNAGPPVVGGATVWTVDIDAGVLYAFDATSGAPQSHTSVGSVEHFATPTLVGNRILVATQHGIDAYAG
ncbi:MAG: PQQ-binding-like beta-propeller repeat protein [Actinobacteria bacterium]|nr:PQQ-binding-like beta-propeller repeat protein [Actinomycetota bacterium]